MSRIGLVLGGGGITGASFQIATLMALELACEWEPNEAEVVVGTSGGAYVSALVRAGRLNLDSMVRDGEDPHSVAERIRSHVFMKDPGLRVGRWLRQGLLPGLRRPGVTMLMGSPARYGPAGLATWVHEQIGDDAHSWPLLPTVITAYDLSARDRVAFGTIAAPDVPISEAVAASSAIPLLFHPHVIGDRAYVDGGVASGTHLDLVLGSPRELDLVIVMAPLAALESRRGAWFPEKLFDRVGRRSLEDELAMVSEAWPHTDVLVLRPTPAVLAAMRPNPMAPEAAVPTFIRTLGAMKRKLAEPEVWELLHHHMDPPRLRLAR